MLRENPVIEELEQLFSDHLNLLSQARQSYPPFLFGTYIGTPYSLFLCRLEDDVYTRTNFVYNHTTKRFYFLSFVARTTREIIGKIHPSSFEWDPRRMACDVEQLCQVSGKEFVFHWNDSWLVRVEASEASWTGPDEIGGAERRLGCEFPRQIDPLQKIREVLELSQYKPFFEILVAQTPCGICRQTIGAHTNSDHQYEPLLVSTVDNTFCKICQKSMRNHGKVDHDFIPDFSDQEPYVHLPGHFFGI